MWKGLISHENVVKTLINAINQDKVAHAYLFVGSQGIGKKTLAKTFAQALFCVEGTGVPCGHCNSCKRIVAGNYPDFHITEPSGNSIKIDQIREIQKSCRYKPYEGLKKVYIIQSAETMTTEAANCLLKVLEEPSKDTVFLLTAENPYMLLPTVISRCQKLNLRPVPPIPMHQWLIGQGVEAARAKVVTLLSDGIPGKALELVRDSHQDPRLNAVKWMEKIQQGDIISVLRLAEDMEKDKEKIGEELNLLACWYRDLLIWAETQAEELVVNVDMLEDIKRQSARTNSSRIRFDLQCILATKKNIQANANLRLCLETLLLKLIRIA